MNKIILLILVLCITPIAFAETSFLPYVDLSSSNNYLNNIIITNLETINVTSNITAQKFCYIDGTCVMDYIIDIQTDITNINNNITDINNNITDINNEIEDIVPYTGADKNVNIGNYNVTAEYFKGNGSLLTDINIVESDPIWNNEKNNYLRNDENIDIGNYNFTASNVPNWYDNTTEWIMGYVSDLS